MKPTEPLETYSKTGVGCFRVFFALRFVTRFQRETKSDVVCIGQTGPVPIQVIFSSWET
jgi:hypothetical protein